MFDFIIDNPMTFIITGVGWLLAGLFFVSSRRGWLEAEKYQTLFLQAYAKYDPSILINYGGGPGRFDVDGALQAEWRKAHAVLVEFWDDLVVQPTLFDAHVDEAVKLGNS